MAPPTQIRLIPARFSRRRFLRLCGAGVAGLAGILTRIGVRAQDGPYVVRFPVAYAGQEAVPTPGTVKGPYYDGDFGYGINTVYPNYETRVKALGFGYEKWVLRWVEWEPSKGAYLWASGDDRLREQAASAVAHGVRIIIRVDNPPGWAAPGSGNRPPSNFADYGAFMGALAGYLKGNIAAYELWNEPNLSIEWGNRPPEPERYAALAKAAYPRIKTGDRDALVLTAGLASTGGDGGATAVNDCEFIERMYRAGAKPYFDGLGSHPYGFANSPETRNANHVTDFQRARDQYAVMVRNSDAAKQVWATEFGWLLDPTAYGHPEYLNDPLWAGRQWQKVSPQVQADYLVRAYQYAYTNWKWMAVMCAFNLDFSAVSWYPPAEPMRWYSVLNGYDATLYSPRPAYSALKAMPKPTAR